MSHSNKGTYYFKLSAILFMGLMVSSNSYGECRRPGLVDSLMPQVLEMLMVEAEYQYNIDHQKSDLRHELTGKFDHGGISMEQSFQVAGKLVAKSTEYKSEQAGDLHFVDREGYPVELSYTVEAVKLSNGIRELQGSHCRLSSVKGTEAHLVSQDVWERIQYLSPNQAVEVREFSEDDYDNEANTEGGFRALPSSGEVYLPSHLFYSTTLQQETGRHHLFGSRRSIVDALMEHRYADQENDEGGYNSGMR